MSVLGIFNIGMSALAAQEAAINVTGENITNVNTPGYSQQTAELETAPASPYQNPAVGNGVVVASVQSSYNNFLQSQINSANSSNSQQTTEQTALQTVEPLFPDLTSNGLGTDIQTFFNDWQNLSTNPQGTAERQTVLSDAQTVCDDFKQINTSLDQVQSEANQSLVGITSNINTTTAQIASLNSQISVAQQSGGNTNQLVDSRAQLIQTLSQNVGISCLSQPDGTVDVSLAGGPQLVSGDQSATLSLQSNPANSGLYSVMLNLPGGGNATDITSLVSGTSGSSGILGGTLQVRDSIVPGYKSNLDELATTLANQVNSLQSTGYGLDGSTGINFFTPPSTPTPPATFTAGYSSSIAVNITDTDDIAASSTDPTQTGGGTGNNVNALAISDLQNATISMSGGSSTIPDFYDSLVGQVGTAVQTTNDDVTQSTATITQLNNAQSSASGVSLDAELVKLTNYQNAYQGAAQLITTGQSMMDAVLAMIK